MVWLPMLTECCVVEILSFASAGGRALRSSAFDGPSARSSVSAAGRAAEGAGWRVGNASGGWGKSGEKGSGREGAGWRLGTASGDWAKSEQTESVSSAAKIAFFICGAL